MPGSEPLVSILIPAYNCGPWVGRAVLSALRQSWKRCEVIVLDDGSTDNTEEELQPFGNTIRVERSSSNNGQNRTRNRLTELSMGEWLVYLDADDELAETSVAEKLAHRNDADVIYGSTNIASYEDEHEIKSEKIVARDYADLWSAAVSWKLPNTSAFCFKRSAVIEAGGWNENIKNCTDYDLYFRLVQKGYKFKAAPDAWSTYRQWSLSQAVNEDPLRKMTTRLELLFTAAAEMEATGGMTAARKHAFFDASLGVLRTIYPLAPGWAREQHERLLSSCPDCRPSKKLFAARYRLVYETIGFSSAERLAEFMR